MSNFCGARGVGNTEIAEFPVANIADDPTSSI